VFERIARALQRRTQRKQWRATCDLVGLEYAEPIASGVVEGVSVELNVVEPAGATRIATGLPPSIGFAKLEDSAVTFGDTLLVGGAALRGDVAVWLRVLDSTTARDVLDTLVRLYGATLRDGTLELVGRGPLPILGAAGLSRALLDAVARPDDRALFDACRRGSLRERLVAVMLLRKQRGDDPRTAALLTDLNESTEPDVQMLADIIAARWSRIRGHADNTRFDDKLLAETVATLRALYPHIDAGTGDARAQLRAICAVLV
jgi:hypothetical protein